LFDAKDYSRRVKLPNTHGLSFSESRPKTVVKRVLSCSSRSEGEVAKGLEERKPTLRLSKKAKLENGDGR
jgi:hypothetical protein